MDIQKKTVRRIGSIIKSRPLAEAIYQSIDSSLKHSWVHLAGGPDVWKIFKRSLESAIRDIEEHPRGALFRRLIEYGAQAPTDPDVQNGDERRRLSYDECGSCVDFIYSHMVNRFKGELAEILALEPCIKLIMELQGGKNLSPAADLYWGDMIQERRKMTLPDLNSRWGSFTKGADGLIVEQERKQLAIDILGVVEVKSMPVSTKRLIDQINLHISRLEGGVKLGERIWSGKDTNRSRLTSIMVAPSTWRLSREWTSVKTKQGTKIVFPENSVPSVNIRLQEVQQDVWRITLGWSHEALKQAGFEMTFWYMSQVGKNIFTKKKLPKTWNYMTPEQAGNNAIKEALFFITDSESKVSERQIRLAAKLYNIYAFGYPLGIDARRIGSLKPQRLGPGVILWPQDILGKDDQRKGVISR
jgi:hypothetical protein